MISNLFENVTKIILTNGFGRNHDAIIISSHYLTYIVSSLLSLIRDSFKRLTQIKMRNVKMEENLFNDNNNMAVNERNTNDLVNSFKIRYQTQIGYDM